MTFAGLDMSTLESDDSRLQRHVCHYRRRTMKTKLALAILLLPATWAGAQDKLADLLRKGVVEEEASQNLEKAIQAYQSVLAQFEQGRPPAATALFRLAECYRKQGRKDQAIAAYRRVLQEFPDQNKLADASRGHLSKTYGLSQDKAAILSPTAIDQRQALDARQRYRVLLLDEIRLLEEQMEGYQKRVDIGTISPMGPEMVGLKRDILELKRTVAAFDAGILQIPATQTPTKK
jgi:tetratricopeptide (TPR) repeat protein